MISTVLNDKTFIQFELFFFVIWHFFWLMTTPNLAKKW
jgi:hypothetical protein